MARSTRALRQAWGLSPIAATPEPMQRYFYLGQELALVRLNAGALLYVDPLDEHVSANVIAHGNWERGLHEAVLSLLAPGARVVEVGANIGYYTINMALRVGAGGLVTALEANPRMVGLIERSARINSVQERIRLIGKAAMDAPGEVTFVTSRRNSGGGFVSIWSHVPYDDGQTITVEAVRLDDLDCGRVDMIRIDAEGTEPFILRGAEAILKAHPDIVVVMEWSVIQMASRTSVPEFVEWLAAMDFQFWRLGYDGVMTPVSAEGMTTLEICDVVAARKPPKRWS
ncbi:FkbM family methyltransferase [Brevundimonas sp. NIBR11]|uniref:FkbM family methyltransferase n=1 Tax=Brevundimonas sp. NIBR11 TaxID=3015999 RepID=UPI0022F0C5AC|nr:FkbM family methyltransferase [Brevundimonas sp. NIBR11]WGM32242.1 hypothetical protein KKHFBJBL_02493 [Brevundimonas sp. NIBR11]